MRDRYPGSSWEARGQTEEFRAPGRHEARRVARIEEEPPSPRPALQTPESPPEPVMDDPPPTSSEPVVIAHAVTVILAAIVAAGWVAIPSTTINAIGSVVAVALSTLGAILARAKVSPTQSIWTVIERYVAELVTDELDRRQV